MDPFVRASKRRRLNVVRSLVVPLCLVRASSTRMSGLLSNGLTQTALVRALLLLVMPHALPHLPPPVLAARREPLPRPTRHPPRTALAQPRAKGNPRTPPPPSATAAPTTTTTTPARQPVARRLSPLCRHPRRLARPLLSPVSSTRAHRPPRSLSPLRDSPPSAPQNLFLSLSSPHSTLSLLFPLLRRPLDLRLSTDTLARAWAASLPRGRTLTDSERLLASRLQTLDARLAYIAYGAGPLTQCAWCRAPTGAARAGGAGVGGTDYLLAVLPGVSVAYLAALAGSGLLLSGNGRERWRSWAVLCVVAAAGYELWARLTWDGARGGVGASVTMVRAFLWGPLVGLVHPQLTTRTPGPRQLHSKLHLLRTVFSALLLLLSCLAPPSLAPSPHPSTAALVAPAVASLAAQGEAVLHRLRALSLQRMAVLHGDATRTKVRSSPLLLPPPMGAHLTKRHETKKQHEQVTSFWAAAAHESRLARGDPAVRAIVEEQLRGGGAGAGEGEGEGEGPSGTFRAWVEGIMRPLGGVDGGGEEGEGEETGADPAGEAAEDAKQLPLAG